MDNGLIEAQAIAVRAVLSGLTARSLGELRDHIEESGDSWNSASWEHRAAAHARSFTLLAALSGDPVLGPVLLGAAQMMELMLLTVGLGASRIILNSRRRLLAGLLAGNADGVALEIERNLRIVCFLWRLSRQQRQQAQATAA